MSQDVLISVVVPVYKVEKYLRRCIESILSQTYRCFELILVDDGSPDNCGTICDDYSKLDNRIKVFHKKNGGLSDARNYGTRASLGKYITYVDSDDWVSPYYIEVLYQSIIDNNADVSVCNIKKTKKELFFCKYNLDITLFSAELALSDMLYQRHICNSACGKLICSDLMKKYLFPVGKCYEDLFTTYKIISDCRKVAYVNSDLYFYWFNSESIMHQKFSPKMFDELEAVGEIENFVKLKFPALIPAALSRKFSAYSQVFRWMSNIKNDFCYKNKKKEIWDCIKSYRIKMLLDKKARIKNRIAAFVSFFGPYIYGKF